MKVGNTKKQGNYLLLDNFENATSDFEGDVGNFNFGDSSIDDLLTDTANGGSGIKVETDGVRGGNDSPA